MPDALRRRDDHGGIGAVWVPCFETIKGALADQGAGRESDRPGQGTTGSLHAKPDAESNSIAILVTHLSGNMVSRWTEFLTTDGEKPNRRRDAEFEPPETMTRAELKAAWERGWACLFSALDGLTPADLLATVRIRGDELSAMEAIIRQFDHYASHIGQIVFLAKHLEWERWRSLRP
jgi:hypothetical protein